jgi:hypothetical protein
MNYQIFKFIGEAEGRIDSHGDGAIVLWRHYRHYAAVTKEKG